MSPLHLVAQSLGVSQGESDCCVCGRSPFASGDRLGSNFSDYELLADPASRDLCAGCTRILGGRPGDDPPPLRTTSFAVVDGEFHTLDRAGMWAMLSAPPSACVVSYAASRQKHHALRAGMSTSDRMLIGGDSGAIEFVPIRDAALISALLSMLADDSTQGDPPTVKPCFSRSSIETGCYSPAAVLAFGAAEHAAAEAIVKPYRRGRKPLLDLLLWCAPAELREAKEASRMIDPFDSLAGQLLGALARGSALRTEDGMRFWGKGGADGLILTRANRFRDLPLRDFVARMMSELRVGPTTEGGTTALAILADLKYDDEQEVSRSIRERTALIVQLAFGRRKEAP